MKSCKSPSHQRYANAVESVNITAALIARDLREAYDTSDETQRDINVQRQMAQTAERVAYAQRILDSATRQINEHFDRGCRNLDPQEVA